MLWRDLLIIHYEMNLIKKKKKTKTKQKQLLSLNMNEIFELKMNMIPYWDKYSIDTNLSYDQESPLVGYLYFKGGYDAHTKKLVKRVLFPTGNVHV